MHATHLAGCGPLVVVDGSERLGDLHEEVPVEAEGVEQPKFLLVVSDEYVVAVVPAHRKYGLNSFVRCDQNWPYMRLTKMQVVRRL